MRFRIVAAGKVKEKNLRIAVDDYLSRIKRFFPVEEIEVIQGRDQRAFRAIEKALPPRYEVWALDAQGLEPTSAEFARLIEQRMDRGTKGIAFVIGGSDGLPPTLVKKASVKLSLSRMTLPHRLARIMLAEQIYRALTILRGEPYSK